MTPLGEGGGDTSDDEEDPMQSMAAMATAEEEVEDKNKDYSEEDTDEEVKWRCLEGSCSYQLL